MNTQMKPDWASNDMRLDPFRLPHSVSYSVANEHGEVHFSVEKRGAVIRRWLKNANLPATIALPAAAFQGVAARAMEDETGKVTVTLELHHADPQLCVPLLVAHDLDDVAADWRAWAEAYRLPMLLVESDGVARTLEESAGLSPNSSHLRRKRASSEPRRSRFLARRKVGDLGLRLIVDGEEIIARK